MTTNFKFLLAGFLMLLIGITNVQAQQDVNVFDIKVHFHCANGKALLEKRLSALEGVEKVFADLETKVVSIEHNPELITTESLIAEIEEIGYYTEFTEKNKKIKRACSHGDDEHQHEH